MTDATEATLELLLASQIFNLASILRQDSWNKFAADHSHDLITDSNAMREWRQAHPVAQFVPEALTSLEMVSKQVRDIRGANP